jgi:hypothetical protein
MWSMSEGSLPPFGLSVPKILGRALGRVFGRTRPKRMPDLASRAGTLIGRHAGEHATLFERAERLTARARRLEEQGTPSESANNRAVRAREEVEAGLAALRGTFVASEGWAGGEAFDWEVGRRFPELGPRFQDA